MDVDSYEAEARLRALWDAGHRLAGLAADIAELHTRQGENDVAARVVAEGLAAEPDDARLLALQARLAQDE